MKIQQILIQTTRKLLQTLVNSHKALADALPTKQATGDTRHPENP